MADIKIQEEAAVTFGPNVGDDVAMDLSSIDAAGGTNPGQISAQHDLGSGLRADGLMISYRTRFAAVPVLDELIALFAVGVLNGLATEVPNNLGQSDANVTTESKLRGLRFLGHLPVTTASTTVDQVKTFFTEPWPFRYLSLLAWNLTANATHATDTNHLITVIPYLRDVT